MLEITRDLLLFGINYLGLIKCIESIRVCRRKLKVNNFINFLMTYNVEVIFYKNCKYSFDLIFGIFCSLWFFILLGGFGVLV